MATKTIELTGTLEWAKLFESNRDNGEYDADTDGATTVDLIMDETTLAAMKGAGIRKVPKASDGGHRVKFKRPWADQYGRDWAAGPPKVFGPDGSEWPDGELIGNGSVGVVFVAVYDTKMGKGCRLNGVQVIDHVAFEGAGGQSAGIKPKDYTSQTAPPKPVTASAPPAPVKQSPGDIPF